MRQRAEAMLVKLAAIVTCITVTGELTAQQKAPVPVDAAERTARKTAGEIYGGRAAVAKTAAEKTALAAEMIGAALKIQNGSADQFVLLKVARDIAIGAGDAATALSAVQELVQRFNVPAIRLPAETLLAVAEQASTIAQRRAVAEAAGRVIEQLSEADEHELALRICEAARSAAQGAREYRLAGGLSNQVLELKRLQQESQAYRDARAVMEANPTEPAANLAAGRYLCFVKGDWERGVPMLALGSDAPVKAVALMDLRGANSAEEQAAIGDAWWDLAETKQNAERDMLRLRAGFWYRQAEPKLSGNLAGLKAKQRLEAVSKLGRNASALPWTDVTSVPGGAVLLLNFEKDNLFQENGVTCVTDLSGAGNHGIIEGGELTPDGRAGSGLVCRRGGVRLPRAILNGRAEYTFTAWIKTLRPQTSSGWTRIYFEFRDSLLCGGIAYNTQGILRVAACNRGRWAQPHADTPAGSVQFGRWVFLAVVFRHGRVGGGTIELLVDERRYERVSQVIGEPPNLTLLGDKDHPINGVLDEVTAYHRALTKDELDTLYRMGQRGQSLTQPGAEDRKRAAEALAVKLEEWRQFRESEEYREIKKKSDGIRLSIKEWVDRYARGTEEGRIETLNFVDGARELEAFWRTNKLSANDTDFVDFIGRFYAVQLHRGDFRTLGEKFGECIVEDHENGRFIFWRDLYVLFDREFARIPAETGVKVSQKWEIEGLIEQLLAPATGPNGRRVVLESMNKYPFFPSPKPDIHLLPPLPQLPFRELPR